MARCSPPSSAPDSYDRVDAACAPLLIGGRRLPGPLGGAGAPALAAAPRLVELRVARRRAPDLILSGLREGCLDELLAGVAGRTV